MKLTETAHIECPYCGARNVLVIDVTAGSQDYVEDCEVCCQPMNIHVHVPETGPYRVEARRDDE